MNVLTLAMVSGTRMFDFDDDLGPENSKPKALYIDSSQFLYLEALYIGKVWLAMTTSFCRR